ncbi:MFS transporter [Leeia sp.]|uniref:AmpG family muropeptide MFS transporter n=1 Tax=Leeia sp. TaxID=2884678 RepID=UPI0035B380B3
MQKWSLASCRRLFAIAVLGFASGLPLALTGQAMQAWLTTDCVDIAAIGLLSMVGLPYTFKFLWAPLMDRFEPPLLGRRRGWLIITQLGLAAALYLMSMQSPKVGTQAFALCAVLIAFLSASQDIVLDAYRTDVLTQDERGMGASLAIATYRLAMILSGGIALLWADPVSGNGWSWSYIYGIMAIIMLGMAVFSALMLPSVPRNQRAPDSQASQDLIGFLAVIAVVIAGYQFTDKLLSKGINSVLNQAFPPAATAPAVTPTATTPPAAPVAKPTATTTTPDKAATVCDVKKDDKKAAGPKKDNPVKKWADMLTVLLGVLLTLPLVYFAARISRFETLNRSLGAYFSQESAYAILALIILYKLGDAFAGSLTTPFLLKGMSFGQAEVGLVNKIFGIWLTIGGALLGGALMLRMGLYRALMVFGVLQLLSNFGFYALAILGKGAWGSFEVPAFSLFWGGITLKEATQLDYLLLSAVGFENITGGMGTAAFLAFLMALCNQRFSATQFALLSAFAAIGRVWVGPVAGVLPDSIGWDHFFIVSVVMAVPGLLMLLKLRGQVRQLETPKLSGALDD